MGEWMRGRGGWVDEWCGAYKAQKGRKKRGKNAGKEHG
jgi:hypothetical protein